jgi:hypothetical protein
MRGGQEIKFQEIDDQEVEIRSPDFHEIEGIFQESESLKRE